MGKHARKTPYKKLLKEEKAKTKLKVSHKTLLPKGQNVTDPSFRVRKIVVKSQLKERSGEIVSKTNLNVKDLVQRLQHHNAPLRIHSLSSLSEMVEIHGGIVLDTHLSALLQAASNLILDVEQEVRTEAIKLLSVILKKTSSEQLSELFEIVIKHLACAMSHINPNIRSSSLAVLDALITRHPKLTARHCQPVILPAFLDLISTKYADSERRLIMQHSETMTTTVWRIKVLTRLQTLLKAIVGVQKERNSVTEKQEYEKRVKWEDDGSMNTSIYFSPFDTTQVVDLYRLNMEKVRLVDKDKEIKNYTASLIPLLMDICSEAIPRATKNGKTTQLSNEAAVVLKIVTDIISLVWQMFETEESSDHLKSWFSAQFGDSILERVISRRFPYSLLEHNRCCSIADKKGNKNLILTGVLQDYSKFLSDQRCVYLNATLSLVYLQMYEFNSSIQKFVNVVQYVTSLLPACLEMDRESVVQLLHCADTLFTLGVKQSTLKFNTAAMITVISELYVKSALKNGTRQNFLCEKTFNHLYKIVLSEKRNASNYPELHAWLDSLPYCLTRKRVSYQTIKCMVDVARCNIPAFTESLDGCVEAILDNLPRLQVIADHYVDSTESKKLIVNMLYHLQSWDDEMISQLKKGLLKGYFGDLSQCVEDLIACKLSR